MQIQNQVKVKINPNGFGLKVSLCKIRENKEAYLFFKRYIHSKVFELVQQHKVYKDQIERINSLIGQMESDLSERMLKDRDSYKVNINELEDKLAYYGIANNLTYEEYVINLAFYNSWLLEQLIHKSKEPCLTWNGQVFFNLKAIIYIPRVKLDENDKPRLLLDRVKSFRNKKALEAQGIKVYSKDCLDGQKYFEYYDKPKPWLRIQYRPKYCKELNNYTLSYIKYGSYHLTRTVDNLNALRVFTKAIQANPDLALTYQKYERKHS